MLRNKWLSMILDVDIMTLSIVKLEISFILLELIVYLRTCHKTLVENHQFKQISESHLFNIVYLHHLLKYIDFSWNFFCHQNLFRSLNRYFLIVYVFFSQNPNLVYSSESLSLNTRQGLCDFHFTVLAPM